ncbi:conserved Plasmodium protein, unknown function [Plasmodium ovale]|uniref:Uncharacterized protein n=1 Tax=Plasmodium ovale TaxID=36330 RepID=A0A1D3TM15_PLAOA|nr:conserved Plasmodium protein, unknown function [Plasmodium ovale]
MRVKYHLYLLIAFIFLLLDLCSNMRVNRKKTVYRLNAETGNISMATMGSSTCHCSIFNHCFSRVKCNLLLLCLTGSAVIAILIIAVFIQRATQIPLRGCPHMCDCFLDSSISPLTCILLHSPKNTRTDTPTHTCTS